MALLRRSKKDAPAAPAPAVENSAPLEKPDNLDRPPRGSSGRAHTAGFLDYEEANADLRHPEGQKVFDKMYRTDGDVRQVVNLTANPVIGGTWSVVPYGDKDATPKDVEVAKFVRWALWEQMRPNLIGHLIEFMPVLIRAGFTPGEVTWKSVKYNGETRIVVRNIALRLPRTIEQWEQDAYGELTRIKQYLPTPLSAVTAREGQNAYADAYRHGDETGQRWLNRKDLVYYRLGAEGDNWEGVSFLRPAYKHWYLKDAIERIDAIAQEREALGVPICYPPAGATPKQLDDMEEILAGMRSNEEGYIIAPGPKAGSGLSNEGTGWLIEVIGYDRTGSGRDPQPSLEYHTQKIAAAFISEFMRLGHGSKGGARATAQVQADPFLMSIEAFATIVEQQLNDDIVDKLVKYNFPDVENPPRLQMSLVDSTSLAQLADYVLKLTQIGAMIPDQPLEDFLRARAELPPSDPDAVKKRDKKDADMRREVVVPPAGQDTFGQNSKPGKPHGTKDASGTNPGATGGISRGKKDGGKQASTDEDGTVTLSYYDDTTDRYYHRPLRDDEKHVNLAALADRMDSASQDMMDACRPHLGDKEKVREAAHAMLSRAYDFGFQSVMDEAHSQNPTVAPMDYTVLSRGARDENGRLMARATVLANRVQADMDDAYFGHHAAHGDNGRALIAAEKAGVKALSRAGYDHGVAAVLHGRHDAGIHLAADNTPWEVMGARYSAVLDDGTCSDCREADDGQVRELDDPVRIHRMPPNPDCQSMHSGHNRCRCFETYEVKPGAVPFS